MPEAPRDARQAARGDDGCAARREDALGLVGVALEELLGDDQREDGVAEELEPLVRDSMASSGCSLT